ncbi:mechanosensitive ion channel family protein [Oceanicoccus sagamiensis]|uniref:Mechanosensitive ion channel protein MscS n=1 Tax=Oceanicoccus sagamiensis TaxID=716816 RepID=A0A1X9NGQ1_9GAMM|nr:mechanosensitive ion channel family protein [Oceanicoccus sagamiensis]ARN75572.1 mechanosensitive ion channel protein MscS [Oceanicoccus sagamiensis]
MNTPTIDTTFFGLNLAEYPWLWDVFVLVLLTLLARYVVGMLLRKLEQQLKKTHTLWDDALLEAGHAPAGWLVWLVGFSWVLEVLVVESQAFVFTSLGPVRELSVVLLLAWFMIRLIKQVEIRLMSDEYSSEPVDATTVLAVGKLVRAAVIITVALVVLQTLGYSISGVLAFGGIGGIAVGFAAKDLLANFFGGLMVYLDRPFAVGDWIRSPDQEIEGTVEHIGWRQTCIRTFDKRPLYIPNATFSHISVENPSRMLNRRIYETIGIRYEDAGKLKAIVTDVTELLKQHEEIDQNQTIIVNFNSFAPSSLDFFVYTFTKTTDWVKYHEVKQRVLLEILDIIFKHDADVAFPTSTVHIPEGIGLNGSIEQPGPVV